MKDFEQFFLEKIVINKDKYLYTNGYFNKKTQNEWDWKNGRCRIDPCFWSEIITKILLRERSTTINSINEYYLEKTRQIQNNNKSYQNSHCMDISAIRTWFKINTNINREELEYIKKYDYNTVKFVIENYMRDVIKEDKINNELANSWIANNKKNMRINEIFGSEQFSNNHGMLKEIIEKNSKEENWNIIQEHELSTPKKINDINRSLTNMDLKTSDDKSNEMVGFHGEFIANKFLVNKYGKDNVKWISRDDKYSPFDFKIETNEGSIYIEVKSTCSNKMDRFFLSINEFNFYKEHPLDYKLLFIWNIYEIREENAVAIFFLEKPCLKISFSKEGLYGKENILYITPCNFRSLLDGMHSK